MKSWQILIVLVLSALALSAGYLYTQARAIDVEQLSDDLWVLRGFGGNTAVLKTRSGAVIVDTMTFGIQGDRIREIAQDLTGMDTSMIINTHYHLDHTHGNPAFDPGTRVLSTERTLRYLQTIDADFWAGDAAQLMPNETFADAQTLFVGDKKIELVHPGPGHTDGDLVVIFVDEGVVHMGDLMFNKHYPNIDLEAGGTIQRWPATLDAVLALNFDRVIPGHGATTDRNGIRDYQRFLSQLGEIGLQAAEEGWTVEQVRATDALNEDAGYEPLEFIVSLGLDRGFVLQRALEETTGAFERHE